MADAYEDVFDHNKENKRSIYRMRMKLSKKDNLKLALGSYNRLNGIKTVHYELDNIKKYRLIDMQKKLDEAFSIYVDMFTDTEVISPELETLMKTYD